MIHHKLIRSLRKHIATPALATTVGQTWHRNPSHHRACGSASVSYLRPDLRATLMPIGKRSGTELLPMCQNSSVCASVSCAQPLMPRCAHRSRDLSHTSRDAPRYVSRRHVLLLPNTTLRERHQHRVVASKREGEPPRFGLETGRFLHEKPTRTGSWDYPAKLP